MGMPVSLHSMAGPQPIPESGIISINLFVFLSRVPGLAAALPGIVMGPGGKHGEMNCLGTVDIHVHRGIHKTRHGKILHPDHPSQKSAVISGGSSSPVLLAAVTSAVMDKGAPVHLLRETFVHLFHHQHLRDIVHGKLGFPVGTDPVGIYAHQHIRRIQLKAVRPVIHKRFHMVIP